MTPISFASWILIAGACGLLATWVARSLALRAGIVNHPNPHVPQHQRPVAYLGGVGIGLGLAMTWGLAAVFAASGLELPTLPAGGMAIFDWKLRWIVPAALFLVAGVWDDLVTLSPPAKLTAQAVIAIAAAVWGCRIDLVGVVALDGAISAFLIVTFVNAFNMTDVCDGLVAMLAAVGFTWAAVLGANPVAMAACAGATLGFWWLNRPDASIFLGDAGTHLLGYLAAIAVVDPDLGVIQALGAASVSEPWAWWAALSCFAVPLFELLFLVVVRSRRGVPIYLGSSDHFSLRLQAAGLSKWATLGVSFGLACVLSGTGWMMAEGGTPARSLVGITVVAGMLAFGRLLMRWDATPRD